MTRQWAALLAGLLVAAPHTGQAATPGDPALLADFIRVQDAALAGEEAAACASAPAEARRALHKKYDLRLLAIIQWLQERFTDEQLKAAEAEVHRTHPRAPILCPQTPEDIAAAEASYAAALNALEARTKEGSTQP